MLRYRLKRNCYLVVLGGFGDAYSRKFNKGTVFEKEFAAKVDSTHVLLRYEGLDIFVDIKRLEEDFDPCWDSGVLDGCKFGGKDED
jgi:hypothetical protein